MNRWDSRGRAARWIPPDDALGTALWLAGRGLWVVPITPPDDPLSSNPGKAPIGRDWGTRRLSTRARFAIFRRHPRAGVGLVFGPAAGVVDLEVDDRGQAGPLLAEFFPEGPPLTMGWSSSRGEHRLGRAGSAVLHLADDGRLGPPRRGGRRRPPRGGPGRTVPRSLRPDPEPRRRTPLTRGRDCRDEPEGHLTRLDPIPYQLSPKEIPPLDWGLALALADWRVLDP